MLSQEVLSSLQILLFDPFGTYKQRISDTLRHDRWDAHLQWSSTVSEFEAALAENRWDAVLIGYGEHALQLAEAVTNGATVILICQNKEQADDAYTVDSAAINDVILGTQLKRLPFVLRREMRRTITKSRIGGQIEQFNVLASLEQLEIRFRSIIEGFNDIILFVDQYQIVRYANETALFSHLGWHIAAIIGRPLFDFLNNDDKALVETKLKECLESIDSRQSFECQFRRADAGWENIEVAAHSANNPTGQPILILHVRIITELKHAVEKIQNLNRTLIVLSDINQIIVRVRDLSVLFERVCRVAVEKGAFRLAWIGLMDPKTRQVVPVGHAGVPDDYVHLLNISPDDEVHGPAGVALKEQRPIVVNDSFNDLIMQPWRQNAVRLGEGSIAALPLMISGQARGIFYLYADKPNFFDDAEMRLVREMAEDIAFAIEFAEQDAKRKQTQEALLIAEGRYHRMLDDLLEGAEIIDFDWNYLYENDTSALHGRMPKEILLNGGNVLKLYPGIEQSELFAYLKKCMDERTPQHFENEFVFPDGTTTWFELSVQPVPEGIFILSLDITERKRSEIALRRYAKRLEIQHEIDTNLIEGGSVQSLVRTTLKHLRQLIPCPQTNITMVDAETRQGTIYAHDLKADSFFTEGVRFDLPDDVFDGYDPNGIRLFNDIRPLANSSSRVRQLLNEGMASLLSAIMIDQDKPIGALVLVSDSINYFTPEHQEIAAQVAKQLAIAIRQLQLSDKLHESDMRYRQVVEDQTDLICRYNVDFKLTFVNQAYATLYAKRPDELIGQNFFALMPEEDRAQSAAHLATLNADHSVAVTEHRSLLPNGSERWIQWTDRALIDSSGHIREYQGVGRDITERKLAEDLLRKSEARQRAMLSAIPDIMFRYSVDGTFLEYHAPDSGLLAASPHEFIGKNATDVLPAELAADLLERIHHVVATKEATQMEYQLEVLSGLREFESRLVSVGDNEVLAIVRDVTERKMAERELQSLYNATSHLFKADSLLSLGRQIVATIVRDFEHVDCGLMLLDKSKTNILRLARTGKSDIQPDVPLHLNGRGLVPLAMRTGNIVYEPDVTQNPDYVPSETTTLSEFVIPLKTANGVIGALDMQQARKNGFSDRDRRILTAYAERAAPAIEIMQLYEALNRHAADLEWRVAQRTVELNYAKERAEAILNHSTDGIILLDSNMIIEQTNLAFNDIFSAQDDAYFERSFTDLFEEAERDRIEQIVLSGMLDKKAQHLEARARRHNGTSFETELSVGFIKKSGVVCVIRDITERKQAERDVAEERNLLRTLIDALPDYIYVKDTQHRVLLSNLARTKSLGIQPDDPIGKDDYAYLPEEIVDQYHADEDHLFQTLQPLIDHEEKTIGSRGDVIWVATTKVPLRNLNGDLIGLVGVTRDISERKSKEQQLLHSEERYRVLAENISDIISRVTPDGVYTDVSPSAITVLGYEPEAMIGKPVINFIHPDDRTFVLRQNREYVGNRKESPLTCRFRHQDGHYVWLEVARKPIVVQETNIIKEYVTSARDVTVRKRAEEVLKNALEREKELSELKSRFVSMASHEFRTPLATIMASTETLSAYRSKLDENQIQDRLTKISEQVTYLKAIIEDTLQVARLQDPKAKFEPVVVDLVSTCRSVIDEFKMRPDIKQEIVFTHDDVIHEARLDRKLIRQIINNLLSNAVKYSASDSTVWLSLENLDGAILLKVRDEGIGISEADLKHLFEPFHRGANVGTISGTGLGLVIAKESVELHAGMITVESTIGVGTTFIVMIPLR